MPNTIQEFLALVVQVMGLLGIYEVFQWAVITAIVFGLALGFLKRAAN